MLIEFSEKPVLTDYVGLSGLYHPYLFMPDSTEKPYTDEQIKSEISHLLKMGASVIRGFYAPGWAWDKENGCWNWETEQMRAFYRFCSLLKDNGIDLIINPSAEQNSKDLSFAGEINPFPLLSGGNADRTSELYGEWCAEFVKEVIVKRNLTNIKYIQHGTEPSWEPSFEKFQRWLCDVKCIDNSLKKSGLRDKLKIIGPNTSADSGIFLKIDYENDSGIQWLRWAVEYGDEYIDIYSAHTYVFKTLNLIEDFTWFWKKFSEECLKIVEPTGKPFWHDEYNVLNYGKYRETSVNSFHGVQIALAQLAMMNSGVGASIVWQLADIKWPETTRTGLPSWERGVHVIGLNASMLRTEEPRYAWYAYSLMSTAIKCGDEVYPGISEEDGVYYSLLKHRTGGFSIIGVNIKPTSQEVRLRLKEYTDAAEIPRAEYRSSRMAGMHGIKGSIEPENTLVIKNGEILDTLPPYSLVVYNGED